MQLINKIRTLGLGFVFETLFDRVIPVWLFRFCSVAVYRLDTDKLTSGSFSKAAVKICNGDGELAQLKEITSNDDEQANTTGVLAKVDGQVAGGLWVASGNYRDYDLGLSFELGDRGAWIYAARVDSQYRRQGIYSHLMAEAATSAKNANQHAPLIGVSALNKGSRAAVERLALPVGRVLMLRVGGFVWARTHGGLKQRQTWTSRCSRRPIQLDIN